MGSPTTVILIMNTINTILHQPTRETKRTLSIEIIKTKKQRPQRRPLTPFVDGDHYHVEVGYHGPEARDDAFHEDEGEQFGVSADEAGEFGLVVSLIHI